MRNDSPCSAVSCLAIYSDNVLLPDTIVDVDIIGRPLRLTLSQRPTDVISEFSPQYIEPTGNKMSIIDITSYLENSFAPFLIFSPVVFHTFPFASTVSAGINFFVIFHHSAAILQPPPTASLILKMSL